GALAEGVGVCDGDLVGGHPAVAERDLHPASEGLLVRVVRVVAAGPLRIFHGGDLVPEGDGVRALGALGGVGVDVVPAAVLQRDGEDVGDGVVEGLPGGGRLIL